MVELKVSARERMDALKDWSGITRSVDVLKAHPIKSKFEQTMEVAGYGKQPLRMEIQSQYGKVLLPRITDDDFLHGAFLQENEQQYLKVGTRLSYVLELPKDNVIHLRNNRIERELDGYSVSVLDSGLIRCFRQNRILDQDTNKRYITREDQAAEVRPHEVNDVVLTLLFSRLLPDRAHTQKKLS